MWYSMDTSAKQLSKQQSSTCRPEIRRLQQKVVISIFIGRFCSMTSLLANHRYCFIIVWYDTSKMATYMDVDRVQYLASSGVKAPICKLYFCRHCLKLRSSDCVSHEVCLTFTGLILSMISACKVFLFFFSRKSFSASLERLSHSVSDW